MLNPDRKRELAELADAVAYTYCNGSAFVVPEIIAKESHITFSYGNYKNAFDGLLEHRSGKFHIYINLDRLREKEGYRTRFTFAHEIAHYYIDEHRNALKMGRVPSHPSFNKLNTANPVEREADYFASCLLMPSDDVNRFCKGRPMSSLLLETISTSFRTSISSVIFRYYELGISPMCIAMTSNGSIDWFMQKNSSFGFGPKKGSKLSPGTLASEYYTNGTRYENEQTIFGTDWFKGNKAQNIQLKEKCYYLPQDRVMSVIWKK